MNIEYANWQKKKVNLPATKKERRVLISFLENSRNVTSGKWDRALAKKIRLNKLTNSDLEDISERVEELFEDSAEFSQENAYGGHGGELDSETIFHYQQELESFRWRVSEKIEFRARQR
ncbi:MAG: hypothetical protein AABY22_31965 [Nanoarchaeota archaeon]